MRDDDAVHVSHRGQFVDPLSQLQPDLVIHVLRSDVRDLLAAQCRQLLRLRNRGEKLLDAYLAGRVLGLHITAGGAGDRASGSQHDNGRKSGVRRRLCLCLSGIPCRDHERGYGHQ
jgi:hypothetical protein